MKLAEFLGRKAEFEARWRRGVILALSLAVIGWVAAGVVWLSGPARRSAAVPRWLRDDLPFWFAGLGSLAPAFLVAFRGWHVRRLGMTCPKCGLALPGVRAETVSETLCCPGCRERIIEDGRRPDMNWSWLEPARVGPWRRPRWLASAPRPGFRRRFEDYQRRSRGLVVRGAVGLAILVFLTATAGEWVPALFRGSSRFQGGFSEMAGWSPVPDPLRVLGLSLALLAAPWVVGPWLLLRRHERILRELRLRCTRCSAALPPRAGLAVGLGRCGSCGAPLESDSEDGEAADRNPRLRATAPPSRVNP